MSGSPDERSIEQALAGGLPQRVGWFRFYFADQRWEWSEQVQQMHGYAPGTITPTTELVLSHKHPDDRQQVAARIDDIVHTRRPFGARFRIVDVGGNVRSVVVVGDRLDDDGGVVIGTHGFYIDVSPPEQIREELVSARVAEIAERRAPIEQAKGMLMMTYGIDEDSAFELLRWRSQETNTKLRLLAEQRSRPSLQLDRGCSGQQRPTPRWGAHIVKHQGRLPHPTHIDRAEGTR